MTTLKVAFCSSVSELVTVTRSKSDEGVVGLEGTMTKNIRLTKGKEE